MSLFSRDKKPEAPETALAAASSSGKTIRLNFGSLSGPAVGAMSAGTLQDGGWVAEPKPGDKMPDGTVFAGISPDTSKPMYTTPADASLTMRFNEAREYAAMLDAHGHKDWRVPSKAELNVLFNNRASICGFNVSGSYPAGWYWSASSDNGWLGWVQRFSDGHQDDLIKGSLSAVRCVR